MQQPVSVELPEEGLVVGTGSSRAPLAQQDETGKLPLTVKPLEGGGFIGSDEEGSLSEQMMDLNMPRIIAEGEGDQEVMEEL